MRFDTPLSWMCGQFGLSVAVLLLRDPQGQLEVVAQQGFSMPGRQMEFLKWAEELLAAKLAELGGAKPSGDVLWPLKSAEAGGWPWNAPAMAAAPVMVHEKIAGLLVFGGRPECVGSASQTLVRVLGREIEVEEVRERLIRLERVAALGEMVFHVAHEINNPLTTIVGYAQLLEDQVPASSREPMQRLKAEAERALEIARNVLSLAHKQEERRRSNLTPILQRALALRQYALRAAGIQVYTELDPDLPQVKVNPETMLEAFLNIVINAQQALETVNGPRILRVCTRREPANGSGGWAQVEIFNNGPAIPEPWLERIFESFFTTKPKGVGTGLGLAIAHAAVKLAHGKISGFNVEGGVLFRLRLPALRGEGTVTPHEKAGVPSPSLQGRRLLVVEDEPHIARLIADVFQGQGCAVVTCSAAEEAAALLEHQPFDALVSDLKLPGKGGRWLFEHVSKSHGQLAQKTLFVTGDTLSESTVAFLRATGQPALSKPFHVRELKAAVKNLFAEVKP